MSSVSFLLDSLASDLEIVLTRAETAISRVEREMRKKTKELDSLCEDPNTPSEKLTKAQNAVHYRALTHEKMGKLPAHLGTSLEISEEIAYR